MRPWAKWLAPVLGVTLLALGLQHGGARASDSPLARAPDGRPLTLTFSDNFDRLSLADPSRPGTGVWRTTFGASPAPTLEHRTLKSNKELQLYVDPGLADGQGRALGLQPFSLHDGVLEIRADHAPPLAAPWLGGYGYTSGLITSQPSFAQTYGYFEARVKLPRGKGLWPAVWLLPADQTWPPEIDIMESVGDPSKAYVTIHTKAYPTQGVEVHPSGDGFHTFAVAWDANQIVSYLDGAETSRAPTPPDMHKPMYFLLNLAIGGDWAGPPDSGTNFPAAFSVDYVRAYRFGR